MRADATIDRLSLSRKQAITDEKVATTTDQVAPIADKAAPIADKAAPTTGKCPEGTIPQIGNPEAECAAVGFPLLSKDDFAQGTASRSAARVLIKAGTCITVLNNVCQGVSLAPLNSAGISHVTYCGSFDCTSTTTTTTTKDTMTTNEVASTTEPKTTVATATAAPSECKRVAAEKCLEKCKAHCNNGVGNGADCRPGRARFANDDFGGAPGAPGAKGGGAAGTQYVTSNKGDNSIVNENLVFQGDVEGTFHRTVCQDNCEVSESYACLPTKEPKTTKEQVTKVDVTKEPKTTKPEGTTTKETKTTKPEGTTTKETKTTKPEETTTVAGTTTTKVADATTAAATTAPETTAAIKKKYTGPVCGARQKENGGSCRDITELRQTVMDLTCQVQAILSTVTASKYK